MDSHILEMVLILSNVYQSLECCVILGPSCFASGPLIFGQLIVYIIQGGSCYKCQLLVALRLFCHGYQTVDVSYHER